MKEHWYLLSEDVLRDFLKRARKESPDILMMELWTESKHYDDPSDDELVTDRNGITTFTLTVEEDE